MPRFFQPLAAAAALSALSLPLGAQTAPRADSLYQHFVQPPAAAKPRVWWHWMQGNITPTGIRQDLLWMQRAGLGGFQNFDANLATPQVVAKRLAYMTPEWKEAFRYATRLADSLRLEMGIAGSPGWSESGGPWVKPADGMKKIVWTETRVRSGAKNPAAPRPSDITGPFQSVPKQPEFGMKEPAEPPRYYQDVAVLAYKLPAADRSLTELGATVTASGGAFQLAQLTDGDLEKTTLLPADAARGYAWIQFAFPRPQTIRAVTMVGGGEAGNFGMGAAPADARALEASDDGLTFRRVCLIPPGAVLQQTLTIPETTARYFRVTVKTPPPIVDMAAVIMGAVPALPKPSPGTEVAELVLHSVVRVNRFEEKDAFAPALSLAQQPTPATPDVINPADVVDLTSRLGPTGVLNWKAPAGNWVVVRFGYSLTGITNHPATPEATGLEVDKLDPTAVRNYFTTYLDMYQDATGGLMGARGGLQYLVTDSWEAGAQNWTPNLIQEFQRRRGYSLLPWLPVLTGHVIKSAEASDQFLWDYRRTLAELVAAYHYDALTDLLAARHLRRYTESHEVGRALIADGMEVKRRSAVPMSAMWTPSAFVNGNDQTGYEADDRESASVAHLYGQNLAAAESMTAMGLGGAAYAYDPATLKPTADLEFASGINRFMIHSMVHQPVDDKLPGLSLGPFGQWFNRHETWASQASAWTAYLARTSYLLQQGRFVADIAYLYGEDSNVTALFGKKLPALPEGYNYDFINADALINLLAVRDGQLVTPSGMSYRVLALDSSARQLSLPALRKLRELVQAGATVAGVRPKRSPSLADDQQEVQQVISDIWGGSHPNVTAGKPLGEVLVAQQVGPDFTYTKPQPDAKLLYVHRRLPDGRDLYWVNNRRAAAQSVLATFRTSGQVPQLWHPETGQAEAVAYAPGPGGTTQVTLPLAPHDAVFVVFGAAAAAPTRPLAAAAALPLLTVPGAWQVAFQPGRGAPATATLPQLASLSESSVPGIRYFSGTATYTKTITAPANWFKSNTGRLWLDLGDVKNLAEVTLNGKPLGIVWKQPFRVDATDALKPGLNKLEVKVTDLWVNRLIGDAQPGATKLTYTSMPFYQADAKLQPAGLLGPVQVLKQ